MALKFHERERLLNDDNDFSANRISITKNGSSTDLISNAFGSSWSSSFSGLSSAFGSELSSTETESEEEDQEEGDDEFIAELTRKMADYMLEEDDEKAIDTSAEHHSEKLQSTISRGPASVPKHNFPAFSDDHSRAVHVRRYFILFFLVFPFLFLVFFIFLQKQNTCILWCLQDFDFDFFPDFEILTFQN